MKKYFLALSLCAVGFCLTALLPLGCVIHTPDGTIYVDTEPPAPQHEIMPPSPGPRYVWVPGHWQWSGNRWVWTQGHWRVVQQGYHRWVPGHWERRGNRWYWRDGHWQ